MRRAGIGPIRASSGWTLRMTLVCSIVLAPPLGAQDVPQLKVHGGVSLPLQVLLDEVNSGTMYSFGADAGLYLDWTIPAAPWLGIGAGLGYNQLPLAGTSASVSLPWAAGGLQFNILDRGLIHLNLGVQGGYSYFLHATEINSSGGLYLGAGTELSFAISRALRLGLSASYRTSWNRWEALTLQSAVRISLGDTSPKAKMEIRAINIDPLLPVSLKWYDTNPVGSMRLENKESVPARNVTVSFYVKEFMDSPRIAAAVPEIRSGQIMELPIFALLSDRVLGITEAMKVPAELIVTYDTTEQGLQLKRIETVRIENRNAMSWADDKRAASFITPKDPTVLKFTKSLAGRIRARNNEPFDLNIRIAVAMLEALRQYGVSYIIDPSSSYAELSDSRGAMDFLQFPRQTLEYRSGDCDDLSILYCSLLESVGVETAFMTIPGHIFMAFALPMAPAQAARSFYRSGLFVEAEGKAWIPVEVTLVQAGFLNAWLRGAQGWYDAGKEARIYPVHAAWTVFEPVGLRLEEATLDFPTEAQVIDSYDRELSRLVSMELAPQEELLKAQLAANRSARNLNSAGTLYARFGRFETARQYFSEAAADGYKAAVINLGLLSFCQADYSAAKDWFMRALELDRSSSSALVGLARCYFELGDLVSASREYDRLAGLDPALAVKVSYLKAGAQMQEAVGRGSGIGGAQLPENWEE